ncbi:ribonuclease T2 [Roseinatronobacter alkalisoli]|uniref:Ribonuclease T2 n=1 Tax=Roseinatronobacter alkalisoli TaxID=3028235 RepID=A0ABT5T8X8_9RHOB|nr:ribonuclease T2 [Roseinatronobacter sp. HJB301]MDD7971578.1 ribonuclease T2 [Roseinatronobacter sp. HJB301]
MRAVFGVVILVFVLAAYAVLDGTPAARAPNAQGHDGYFILSISWTPSWCAYEGDSRNDDRCARGSGAGWLVHGLWPQNADGTWPEFCDSSQPAPSRAQTAGMTDIMGSSGLAWHQWRKHGTCSNLSADAYFAAMRSAFNAVQLPPGAGPQDQRVQPADLMGALKQANPDMQGDVAFLTCHSGRVQELRICLSHDLGPTRCDARTLERACAASPLVMPAVR